MDDFRKAQVVRLRTSDNQYLVALDEWTVALSDEETQLRDIARQTAMLRGDKRRGDNTWWSVEFVVNSDSFLRLKSCYGKYLAASDEPSPAGMTGCDVLQVPPLPDFSLELEPVKQGTQVKLRTHHGTFLCAYGGHPHGSKLVTHDLSPSTTILWDVEVVKGEEKGSATNIDDKSSEEGSATKRRHETGEGSSVTKGLPGDSGLIREGYRKGYRHLFWELKRWLLDDSGRKDVLVKGGLWTTALIRDVCADVREHFGTIAWISIPQENDSALIREEILLQLIFERVADPLNFDMNSWMWRGPVFSLHQKAKCLIVVDNLDDPRTWKKFNEILQIVETCRVIFLARRDNGSSYSKIGEQIQERGCELKTYELEGLSCAPPAMAHLKNLLEKGFASPAKEVYQLIVKKCQRLPTAIVFVLRNREEQRLYRSKRDEWEARIPSDNLSDELHVIQQVLTLCKDFHTVLYKDVGDGLDHIRQVLEILLRDNRLFCFLYLSIFPKNRTISCRTVSRLWVAEGFLTDPGRAELFLGDLHSKKCIHSVEERSNGELSKFKVDERVQEIIVSLSDLRDPVTITGQGSTKWLSVQGTISALIGEKTFQLSSILVPDVSSNEDKTTTSEASPLETSETPSFPSELKHSKVLDLTGAPFQIIPDELFDLTDARYLGLRNSSIKEIPGSIEKLSCLEFLDAKHSLVTKLPRYVARLKKIRHILIYHHKKDPLMESYKLIGFKALCRVGGLTCLEKLCFVEADDKILEDLKILTNLKRLGITKLREEHGKLLCPSLEELKELESLNVHALNEDEILDLSHLSSWPKNLKRLYLHGRLKKLPDGISSLNDLTKIILRWSQLKQEDPLATLGKLKNLVELELRRAYDGEQLDFKKGQFQTLKILLLEELQGLRSMSLEQGTLPNLESLTISRCQWLERLPSGIEHIGKIQKLTFFDMSHEFYEKVREDHEKNNYQNFAHIEEVYFTRWRAGHWETHQVDSADEEVESPEEEVESTDG